MVASRVTRAWWPDMSIMSGGSMDKLIKLARSKKESFEVDVVSSWVVQILLALNYMHAHHVLHRDLKPGNIFLTSNKMIKASI